MKVLQASLALLLLYSALLAKDNLQEYISKDKQEFYRLEGSKNENSSSMLRDSWIAPIMLNYSDGTSKAYDSKSVTKKTSITIDQPIFQSGGIYLGIKYAEASRIYSKYSIEVAKRKVIKDAISYLMQIKQSDEKIKKQTLLIANAEINLEQKRESYTSGQLDSGFLNNAILEKNIMVQTLYELQAGKERLLSKFRAISDLDYKSAHIPHLQLIEEDEFLKNNIVYEQAKSLSEKNRYSKNSTVTKYLPKVSIYGGYNWDEYESLNLGGTTIGDRKTDYANYGFKASMPININALNDMEVTKIEYLESKINESDTKRSLKSTFEQVMENINNFEKKRDLSEENKKLYGELLQDTKEQFAAGYKTQYDVEVLQNSLNIQDSDIVIYEYDKQLELLTLYEMYVNEI